MKMHSKEYDMYVGEELTSALIEGIEAETIAEAERIEREREDDERLWDYLFELRKLIDAGETDLWDIYSDVYKDLHGIRPRH